MKMSFGEYIRYFRDEFIAEVDLKDRDASAALNLLFSVLALNFMNKGHFSSSEIMIAQHGKISHQRDMADALQATRNTSTDFSVGSYRLFARNYSDRGDIVSGQEIPETLKESKLQVRFVESWLGDKNGEPEEKRDRLLSIMSSQQNMQKLVRQNFSAIDTRRAALDRLNRDQWNLKHMPIERYTLQLEQVDDTRGLVRFATRNTITELLEVDVMHTLGGDNDLIIRDSVGRVIFNRYLDKLNSREYIEELPSRLERAHVNFYK